MLIPPYTNINVMSRQMSAQFAESYDIVDADAHVMESLDGVLEYVDDDHRVVRDQLSRAGGGDIFSTSSPGPADLSFYGEGTSDEAGDEESVPVGATGERMAEHMADFGFDHLALNPTTFLAINTINNPRFAVPLASAYNAWVEETFLEVDDRFHAAILVPAQRPERAAEEISRRADHDGFVSVSLPTAGLRPPMGHERYDPIYEAAQDHDLPIVLHGVSSGVISTIPTIYQWSKTKAESIFFGHQLTQLWNLSSAICHGLPGRFPDLTVVFQEAGIGYVPYMKWQLDDQYMELSDDFPYLDRRPSSYFGDSFYFTTQPVGHTADHPEHLAQLVEMADPSALMYSADFPHPTFDPPRELLNRIKSLDDEDVEGIMGGNARELFEF